MTAPAVDIARQLPHIWHPGVSDAERAATYASALERAVHREALALAHAGRVDARAADATKQLELGRLHAASENRKSTLAVLAAAFNAAPARDLPGLAAAIRAVRAMPDPRQEQTP